MNQEAKSATDAEMKKPTAQDKIQARFEKFHGDNPVFYRLLVKYTREAVAALEAKGRGRHYGIAAVVERVRWHVNVEASGIEEFKMPNDFRSRYARLIMKQEPDLQGVFELRELRADDGRKDREGVSENGN
jgi:hypothetical protein